MIFNILKKSSKNKIKIDNNILKNEDFEKGIKNDEKKDTVSNIFPLTFFESLYWEKKNLKYSRNNFEKKYYKQNIVSFLNDLSKIKREVCDIGKIFTKPSKKKILMRNLIQTNKKSLKRVNSSNKNRFNHINNTNPVNNIYKLPYVEKKYNTHPSVLKLSKSSNDNQKTYKKIIYQKYIEKVLNQKQNLSKINCNTIIDKNINNDVISNNSITYLMNNNYKNNVISTEYPNRVISRKKIISSSSKHCVKFDEIVKLIIFSVHDNNNYIIIDEPLKNDNSDISSNEDSTKFYSYTPTDIKYETKSNVSFLDFIPLDDLVDNMTIIDINNNHNSNF